MPVLTLVTPPDGDDIVTLADLRLHLRVDQTTEDTLITALRDSAIAHLDGWGGVLGRAIAEQQWRQDFTAWGDLRLALPDVSEVTVTAVDADGADLSVTGWTLKRDDIGWYVEAQGDGSPATVSVTMTCALPEDRLPAVRAAVKLLVGHWFANREAVSADGLQEVPVAVSALIAPLRWAAA